MGILQILKSFLGMDSNGRSRGRAEPDVTVERKPSAETERAVKTAVDDEPMTDDTGSTAAASAPEADDAEADSTETGEPESAEPSPPVVEITGIGPTYAERLEAAGIETVADLADSDLSTVVEAAQATESRAEDWLAQARDR